MKRPHARLLKKASLELFLNPIALTLVLSRSGEGDFDWMSETELTETDILQQPLVGAYSARR